jgi:hypothetical protein
MRHSSNLPWDDGSHRSPRCPPSHSLMALPSHPVQASARTACPSGPLTRAVPQTLLAPVISSYRSTARFSDAITENSRPQNSWPKYPKSWPRLTPCWPGYQWSRCTTPPPLHNAGGAPRRQHVIYHRPERVHPAAWQRGQWHPRLLPQRQQCPCRAWLILQRQLGPIPPIQIKQWGGFPKGRWHPCLLPQRQQHHR